MNDSAFQSRFSSQSPARPAIAYLASTLPRRSETFVYREIRALRQRGWNVHAASLHQPSKEDCEACPDIAADLTVVYGPPMVWGAIKELIFHPVHAAAVICGALSDACCPGEAMGASNRFKLLGQSIAALALAKRLRVLGVRHIHCHFAHAPATVGMYAARQLGVNFSFTGHANDLFQRRLLLLKKLKRAAFVSCISQWHRNLYRQILPRPDDVYRVIRCGVDVDSWAPGRGSITAPIFRILTVCRLVEKKGIDTLLKALAELRAQHSIAWRLTVAGDGPEGQALHRLATELGLTDSINWLGAVGNEQVPGLLKNADLFVLPCRTSVAGDRDGIPVVLMEAMACGVAVVSGDLPAIRELVEDRHSGRLVDGTDAKALAQVIAELAADPEQQSQIGLNGRRRVEEEFSLAANIDRLEAALHATFAMPASSAGPQVLSSRRSDLIAGKG
ncbi:MAG TPA: glycosyltransferase family 4 protein [Tepidisphaeraceae bacterium]|nr:glycosyltransferase family 4 protein [Tepidisphaeraceae bacterium]